MKILFWPVLKIYVCHFFLIELDIIVDDFIVLHQIELIRYINYYNSWEFIVIVKRTY